MPQVIRSGKTKPKNPPPAGLEESCPQCGAILKTTSNEPDAVATSEEDHQITIPGWKIPCPECSYKVFFKARNR